ncbi:MAG: ATP phosphoribosyltransferase regulatory subunit [Chloroflexaceae bacterium]|nr:ATP phosphoribosyltransferase regulatory subunit [Chloroflexaceae bacterium]
MIHQPLAGARDLLPLEVVQKAWINDRLQEVFARWGYQRLVTSTLERLETLQAGGAIDLDAVLQLQDRGEGCLGLRPELTASIARTAATRLDGGVQPQRLCYRANVFRQPAAGHHGGQVEFYQAGVELLCAGSVLADGEMLLLLGDCLTQLGLSQWQLILGEAGLTRSLIAGFPPEVRSPLRRCIAQLDRLGLEALPLSPQLQARALRLFDLRGEPSAVLAQLAEFELDTASQERVHRLKSLLALITDCSSVPLSPILDLSLLETFDYYTGILFQVVGRDRQWRVVGKGGRYDQLLGIYHPQGESAPGIGFSFYIDDLYSCLLAADRLPQTVPPLDWLVIPRSPDAAIAAFNYAKTLRGAQQLVRVEIELLGRSEAEIRDYARTCSIQRLAWIAADGSPTLEQVAPA